MLFRSLRPDEIWDFHIDYEYIHHTFFRHSKHIYKIDPNKFTAKRVNLTPNRISFGKWHLAEESIYRYVTILEEDESIENTYENEYETPSSTFERDTASLNSSPGTISGIIAYSAA